MSTLVEGGGKGARGAEGVGLLGQVVGARLRPAGPAHSSPGFIDTYELLPHRVFIDEQQQHFEVYYKELISDDSFNSIHKTRVTWIVWLCIYLFVNIHVRVFVRGEGGAQRAPGLSYKTDLFRVMFVVPCYQ